MLMISLYIANVNTLLYHIVMEIVLAGRGAELITATSELRVYMGEALVKLVGEATVTAAQLEEELEEHFQGQLMDSADKTAFELMDESDSGGINASMTPLDVRDGAQAKSYGQQHKVYTVGLVIIYLVITHCTVTRITSSILS